MKFDDLGLVPELLTAVREEGYDTPTPIQEKAIPPVLAGHDLLGCAQTGTGKTAAFALPILQRLMRHTSRPAPRSVRVLVLAPTRELAAQIDESFRNYGKQLKFRSCVIFGGVGMEKQVRTLAAGIEILVATPGRLLDLMSQRAVTLAGIDTLVLDEADRMLDMGFIHDVRRILREVPRERQTLFFSATMPSEIRKLASEILSNPVEVAVTPVATTAETVNQRVFMVDRENKRHLLTHLLEDAAVSRTIVFTRTKHLANRVSEHLVKASISSAAIHGNKSQAAREKALAGFKNGSVRVLVATDIAARGIDVDAVSHVINYDLPNEPESYVHRIGRTGRAGAAGTAWSFCDAEERSYLRQIERTIRKTVPVENTHPFVGGAKATPASAGPNSAFEARPPMPQQNRRPSFDRRPSSQGASRSR